MDWDHCGMLDVFSFVLLLLLPNKKSLYGESIAFIEAKTQGKNVLLLIMYL